MVGFLSDNKDFTSTEINRKANSALRGKIRENLINEASVTSALSQWTKIPNGNQQDLNQLSNDVYISVDHTNFFINFTQFEPQGLYQILVGQFEYHKDFHESCVQIEANRRAQEPTIFSGFSLIPRRPFEEERSDSAPSITPSFASNHYFRPRDDQGPFENPPDLENVDFTDFNFEFLDQIDPNIDVFLDRIIGETF